MTKVKTYLSIEFLYLDAVDAMNQSAFLTNCCVVT